MRIDNLYFFLDQFFTDNGCHVTKPEENELVVQLTRELDIALMNRPFYWHYMDKIGQQGMPMSLHLHTGESHNDPKKEWIHYGSPRLQQIFHYIQTHAKTTVLYEEIQTEQKTALYPWLIVNLKIDYIGKQKKEEVNSLGLHLINGTILNQMMEILQKIDFKEKVSDYSYTITPIITPSSGFHRIFRYSEQELLKKDHTWAIQSKEALEEELNLLRHFFQDQDADEDLFHNEAVRLKERFEPRININIINAGIFYISEKSINQLLS
ncbi:hypothetical protein F9U64_16090 [Gracilibacillus oryzae]|uniref:YqhG family protein n=1 Tax=Gracilibacillus oryzae TaxID=1672701 RepID=A0A7C8KWY7_9BACI|nr:YqhG family protein [Gracilibacillus oryzae]KAB8128451.1 hypothetical protein F9U64_16090 [Gracilibacillus oryzae]